MSRRSATPPGMSSTSLSRDSTTGNSGLGVHISSRHTATGSPSPTTIPPRTRYQREGWAQSLACSSPDRGAQWPAVNTADPVYQQDMLELFGPDNGNGMPGLRGMKP